MDLRDNNPQKKWKNREFTASFEFALTGIITAFKEERNMRKHLVSAILVVLAGLIFSGVCDRMALSFDGSFSRNCPRDC